MQAERRVGLMRVAGVVVGGVAAVVLSACPRASLEGDGGVDDLVSSPPSDVTAPTPPDLAAPDLASTIDLMVGERPPGMLHRFVIRRLLLPETKADYAIDLNGDGRVDNQFGNVVGAFASQGLDLQAASDAAVVGGRALNLLTIDSIDPNLASDDTVTVTAVPARAQSSPDFGGQGQFTVDPAVAPGAVTGRITASRYSAESPVTTTHPATVYLRVAPFGDADPLLLPLHGASIAFEVGVGGTLRNGAIRGSIRKDDVERTLIPGIAMTLDATVQRDPTSDNSKSLLLIFDVGIDGNDCTNPDGSRGRPGDGRIAICEVSGDPLIQNVLVPDVDIYAPDGITYQPNPCPGNQCTKDSLSVAIGFEAVGARF